MDLFSLAGGLAQGAVALTAEEESAGLVINGFWIIVSAANFLFFLFVIWALAFRPISTMLSTRRERIEQGLRDAEQARRDRESAEQERLAALAEALLGARADILAANRADLEAARAAGLDAALLDRLELTPTRIEAMAAGVREVAELPDPVGGISDLAFRPSGIQVGRMRVPLGVVGIIYEARPNVTADAAALCLKSGNAAILRGGKEALRANQAIAACVRQGLAAAGLPQTAVQVVETTDREAVSHLVAMPEYVDVIVPRGGKGLIERISKEARVPVIKHLDGNCHVYIDLSADPAKALKILENAKCQRLGTCNTAESLLVARPVAQAEGHVVPHRGPREDAVLLEDEDAPRVGAADLDPVDGDHARVGRLEAADDVEQRGLAAARRPEQAHELARGDAQVDVLQHLELVVLALERLAQAGHLDLDGGRDRRRRGGAGGAGGGGRRGAGRVHVHQLLVKPQRTSSKRSSRRMTRSSPTPMSPMVTIEPTTRS